MTKNNLSILIFGLLTCSCTQLEQNNFISTEKIGQLGNEEFIYSAFQTGFDNYRIEFKSITDSDTSRIFDYYINDAKYSKENSFRFRLTNDTLFVLTSFQSCKIYYKTEKGTILAVTRAVDTKICED